MAAVVTFHGYKILANAKLVGGDTWTGSYIIEKDGQLIRVCHSITWRNTAKFAEAGALVFGIQFVDNCMTVRQMAKASSVPEMQTPTRVPAPAND
jgi:hypothetical protein